MALYPYLPPTARENRVLLTPFDASGSCCLKPTSVLACFSLLATSFAKIFFLSQKNLFKGLYSGEKLSKKV